MLNIDDQLTKELMQLGFYPLTQRDCIIYNTDNQLFLSDCKIFSDSNKNMDILNILLVAAKPMEKQNVCIECLVVTLTRFIWPWNQQERLLYETYYGKDGRLPKRDEILNKVAEKRHVLYVLKGK